MVVLRNKDIMVYPVITIQESAKVSGAASKMCVNNTGSLVVMDREEKPIGIVTERDMLSKIVVTCKDPKSVKVNEIMSSPLITSDPDRDLEYAAKLMIRKKVKRLPIVESGKLVGILTLTDIVNAYPQIITTLEKSLAIEEMPRRFKKWMKKKALRN